MEEDFRRESSKYCSASGRARRLRDVHPGELFLMTSESLMKQSCESKHNSHLQGVAIFPKKRRAAGASAPASMGKVSEGQGPDLPARTTAACCTPTSVLCHTRDMWPDSSADSRCSPEGQLMTGVHPARGLLIDTLQAQKTFLPIPHAAGSLPCRSCMPARLVTDGAIGQPTSQPASYSVPAASATSCCPHSTRAGRGNPAGSNSCPGVSAASGSAPGWQRSQTPVWPQRSAPQGAGVPVARVRPQDSASRPLSCVTTRAMSEEEMMYMPAKGQPLRLCLADWGLPFAVTQAYAEKGVKEMYPWQAAALEGGLDGSNLVYCAPTSGGKSLVAEILMLRRLLSTRQPHARFKRRKMQEWKFALFVLPYISVVAEKAAHFTDVLRSSGCKCKGFYGNSENGTPLQPGGEAVAVCTIEKANVAINRLVQEDRLGELCCIVIDEVHMLNDPQRGPALELAITKILHSKHADAIQIVGMSATMGGLDALSKWLNCRLFLTNFRPVSLTEHAIFQGTIFTKARAGDLALEPQRQLPESDARDRDLLLPLVAEVVGDAGSVLVFCASRKQCQSCAELIADLLPGHVPLVSEEVQQAREELAEGMRGAMGGFADAALERLMRAGVAWHHAGLTLEERAHVEAGYRVGSIRVLCATSTLAAGINLPARRVILRSLWQGPGPVSRSQYLQMVGRAGRAGYSEVGESYIIGQGPAEAPHGLGNWHAICELLHEPLPLLQSRLLPQDAVSRGAAVLESGNGAEAATAHFQRLLLEAVANGSASGHSDIESLLCCTLIRHQAPASIVDAAVKLALGSLRQRGLLSFRALPGDEKPRWRPTLMGNAVHSSSLPIHLGERLYEELEAGLQNVSMDDLLHPVFLVLLEQPFEIHDWSAWSCTFQSLSAHHRRVASAVGVTREHMLIRMSGGRADQAKDRRHARFAAACAVNALLCETPAWQVAEEWGKPDTFSKAGLSRGQLQKLQADVAGWAAMASQLSASAGWLNLEPLLMRVSQQATAGACPELLDLMQIPEVTAAQARALYRAGITNPEVLAATAQLDVERALCDWLPAAMRTGSAARPRDARSAAARVGVTGQPCSNALVRRSAKLLLTAAREHILASAQAAWQEGDSEDTADAVPQEGASMGDRCKGDEDVLIAQGDFAEFVRSVDGSRGTGHSRRTVMETSANAGMRLSRSDTPQ